MQTNFTAEQRENPIIQDVERILRSCVHCGFCTATCPTYQIKGDELDSPRGRIYLIKNMFEQDHVGTTEKTHIDRCLSCLSCMTTCPSGVDYMHLVDHARAKIAEDGKRNWIDWGYRKLLGIIVPNPTLFRLSLLMAKTLAPFKGVALKLFGKGRIYALLSMVPDKLPSPSYTDKAGIISNKLEAAASRGRVAIWPGCAQQVLAPSINAAAIRILLRLGFEIDVPPLNCCGALVHHMGEEKKSHLQAKNNVKLLSERQKTIPYQAIISTTSGCGTTLKDYGTMLGGEDKAVAVSKLVKDVSEFIFEYASELDFSPLKSLIENKQIADVIAFHAPCSLQHGQRQHSKAISLLKQAGFTVKEPKDSHLCCGSAGVYNLLQPEMAEELKLRKQSTLAATGVQLVATSNIGCIKQLSNQSDLTYIHIIELLDWASGGEKPEYL